MSETHSRKEGRFILGYTFSRFSPWLAGWLQGSNNVAKVYGGGKLFSPWWHGSPEGENRSLRGEYTLLSHTLSNPPLPAPSHQALPLNVRLLVDILDLNHNMEQQERSSVRRKLTREKMRDSHDTVLPIEKCVLLCRTNNSSGVILT